MSYTITEACLNAIIRAEANYQNAEHFYLCAYRKAMQHPTFNNQHTLLKAGQIWWLASANRNFN